MFGRNPFVEPLGGHIKVVDVLGDFLSREQLKQGELELHLEVLRMLTRK